MANLKNLNFTLTEYIGIQTNLAKTLNMNLGEMIKEDYLKYGVITKRQYNTIKKYLNN
jgi:hypothetical protein